MVYFPPLLWALVCASRWRGLLRLDIVSIARPSLFHYIGAYYSRASIELRRALRLSGWLPGLVGRIKLYKCDLVHRSAIASRNGFVYPSVSYLLPKLERFARPNAFGCVVLQAALQ